VRSHGEIWRQRLWIWVPALLFFLANAGAFAVYTLGYAGQINSLQEELDNQKTQLKELGARRDQMQTMIALVQTNEMQVEQLYTDRLSTRSQRLTSITAEVKKLARDAGLAPKSISYPEEEIQEYSLIKRSFVFTVEGTYANLRRFIDLLETSHSFLSIDEATVANNVEGPELRIDLTLSTLFARDAQDEPAAPVNSAAPATPAAAARRPQGGPGGAS
jgi:Tfp pilus assembly protein PilO